MILSCKQAELLLDKFKNTNNQKQKRQIKKILINDYKKSVKQDLTIAKRLQ